VKKTRPAESFFNFFSPPKQPSEEEQEDMDPDELDELEAKLSMDYNLGEEFKDKVHAFRLPSDPHPDRPADRSEGRRLVHGQGAGL
jgi:hypothetical protein